MATAQPDPAEPEFISAQAVADLLSVHVGSVRTWARKGVLPHERMRNGQYRFDLEVIRRFVEERRTRWVEEAGYIPMTREQLREDYDQADEAGYEYGQ